MKIGTNIHYDDDGKVLCSSSLRICKQKRIKGFGFCFKHILEDEEAPFVRCSSYSRSSKRYCTNPVPKDVEDSRYCATHRHLLGLAPMSKKKANTVMIIRNGKLITKEEDERLKEKEKDMEKFKFKSRDNRENTNGFLQKNKIKHSQNYIDYK
eukprot:TRINITY_DN11948_c0_g2_i1.p1 TRINITY_DN11948_c0_g2~~TRINITY_DN11948_c0_g2_i1.p1  ORF type:complete len:153 (+),score=27.30 TRINITY_DN11948_c0_g2_i1:33-491(+)